MVYRIQKCRTAPLLTSPDIEARIVLSEGPEVLLVDGEEATRHGGTLDWLGGVLGSLGGLEAVPGEDEVPVETSHSGQTKLGISELVSDHKLDIHLAEPGRQTPF